MAATERKGLKGNRIWPTEYMEKKENFYSDICQPTGAAE